MSNTLHPYSFNASLEDLYVLVKWPFVQQLMEADWFRSECILYQAFDDQEHVDSAYFVPLNRLYQAQNAD